MCNLHLQVEADSWAVHAGRAPDLSSRQGEDAILPHTQVVERGRGGSLGPPVPAKHYVPITLALCMFPTALLTDTQKPGVCGTL